MSRRQPDFETAMATAAVLAWRLPMLWAMAWHPTPKRRAEALRMVTEKSAAAAEGIAAAWSQAALAGVRIMGDNPMEKVAEAALKPARRRVRANARRLRRKRI